MRAIFFGAPHPYSSTIKFENGKVFSDDPWSQSHIMSTAGPILDIDAYDVVVICGFGLRPLTLINLYKTYRADTQHGAAGAAHLLSQNCYDEVCLGLIEHSHAVRLAKAIRAKMEKPVWVLPQPFPSEEILKSKHRDVIREIQNNGDERSIAKAFNTALKRLSALGIRVLAQSPETKATALFTDVTFSSAGVRLLIDTQQADTDFVHTNELYGTLVVQTLLDKLAA